MTASGHSGDDLKFRSYTQTHYLQRGRAMRSRNLQPAEGEPLATTMPDNSTTARRVARSETVEAAANAPGSLISSDIVITGNIEASADLHIQGKVIGDVRCATLILAEGGYVNGRILAARVKVAGTVEGTLDAQDLAIEATARVTGDTTYQRLRVANGGAIEGKVSHKAAR